MPGLAQAAPWVRRSACGFNRQLSPNLLLVLFAVLAAVIGLWTLFTGKASESNGAQSLSLAQARLQSISAKLTLMTFGGSGCGYAAGNARGWAAAS